MPKKILRVLPKWITLSVRKQFIERSENVPVYVEEQTKINEKDPFYFELRIDGPFCTTIGTRGEIEARIEVNALLSMAYDEKDSIKMARLTGILVNALEKDFCVYKLGGESEDNEEYFETLQLITDDNIEASNFGQIDPTLKIYQTSVEAHYKMRFKNGTV